MKPFERKPAIRPGRREFILLVAALAFAWWWLARLEGGVDWLKVEAPPQATVGEPLPIHVFVAGLAAPSFLCVDLHWSSKHDQSNGYLASGGAKRVGKEGGSFDFAIAVPATNALRFVTGIIFLSPTGDWNNHTFAGATGLIPVTSAHDARVPQLVRLPLHQLVDARRPSSAHPKAFPRFMTGCLLLAAAIAAWATRRSISCGHEISSPPHRRWPVLVTTLTLACIWELSGLENRVLAHARTLARAEDLYYSRELFQKLIISVIIASALASACFLWRKRGPCRLLLFSLGLYLASAAVNLFSFHALDQYAELSWHGITLVNAVKLMCAAGTVIGVRQANR